MKHVDVDVAGVTVRCVSDTPDVLEVVRKRFPSGTIEPLCELRVSLAASGSLKGREPAFELRGLDEWSIARPGFEVRVDLERRVAAARVEREAIGETSFQQTVIQGAVYSLITRCDRHPVHAAALRHGESALLLHGPSGVGKSTLVYMASRIGCDVLTDDATRVQLSPELRVWGDGTNSEIHLLPDARREFPELNPDAPSWESPRGVKKLVVRTNNPNAKPFATRARVCLLERDPRATPEPSLIAVEPDAIFDAICHAPDVELDLAPDQRKRVARALAAAGGWRLSLSRNPNDALPLLRHMLDAM